MMILMFWRELNKHSPLTFLFLFCPRSDTYFDIDSAPSKRIQPTLPNGVSYEIWNQQWTNRLKPSGEYPKNMGVIKS